MSPPRVSTIERVAIWVLIGDSSSGIVDSEPMELDSFKADGLLNAVDSPDVLQRSKAGNCIPPSGPPKPRGSGLNINCGDEWWCRMVVVRIGPGDGGGALFASLALIEDVAEVCRLNMLGFFLAFGIGGLTKDGDDGAEICEGGLSKPDESFNASPFAFLGFLGEGDVIGRA